MSKPCEYCGHDLPFGVDKKTRQTRSRHFDSCEVRLSEKLQESEKEIKDEPPQFPTMLRKMWSGREVQDWINEHWVTPPQRKPLTDEEIGAILEGVNAYGTRLYTFARAIEAAHGITGENT